MNKVPNYPCRLFHKTKQECQLVKNEMDHKKLHQWKEWVMEDETSYYKPEIEVPAPKEESAPAKEEDFALEAEELEVKQVKKPRSKGKAK